VVFVPKRRRKKLLGEIRRARGPMFPELARQQACRLIEGHVMPEHIPLCIAVPPKSPKDFDSASATEATYSDNQILDLGWFQTVGQCL
jgi:REP element-mobilizing transposase RayT